ncbi:MAG: hypothetical protein P8Z37_04685 [Acidobacteriota bacterium]|jgi:copper(I)-binding protein
MKQRLMIAALGMLLFSLAVHAADLGVSESIIDFGTVPEGPPVVKTVTLTNSGEQPLTIANAAAS